MSEQSDPSSEALRYPFLVQLVPDREAPSRGGTPTEIVEAAISETLGWRLREDDVKGFRAALTKAFHFKEVEGHREYVYKPRSVTIRADLGEVTGAQASILLRARAAIDQAVPLLDGLTPLESAPDKEQVDASRAIVRGKLEELVNELGAETGPRVVRVDDVFNVLLGRDHDTAGAELGGELRRLGERFGFTAGNVNTLDEERSLTDYVVLVDYVKSLAASWAGVRENFDRAVVGRERFFGTQLVVLSRHLHIVSETVRDVRAALSSAFIGDEEADLIEIKFQHESRESVMTLGEGLRWIDEVATVEGPELIEEAGKEGVSAVVPTLGVLRSFVSASKDNAGAGGRSLRVKQALADLELALAQTADATSGIGPPRPSIGDALPSVLDGSLLSVTVFGRNLRAPANVVVNGQAADRVVIVDDSQLHGVFTTPPAVGREFDVTVTVDGEQRSFRFGSPTAGGGGEGAGGPEGGPS